MDRGRPGGKGNLLNDEGFISRLAERVASYSASRSKRVAATPAAKARV